MSTWLCLRWHRTTIRQRFLCPGLALLYCDRCEAIR
jgi:hypothetical protein